MIRSGACIMGTLLFAASFSVNALTSNDFDPRDPAIWQEETATTCEVRHHPDCATWEDEKSDIQRERERRDQRRLQNLYKKYSHRD
ncbi:TPA: hypothetical protein ACU22X_002441 [Salmonella enterica]|uniref:hypothetical protein n=1 Tax=Salmonella enterica TaxID=28901 RepID=UPI0012CD5C06|nr:hypothetical protein [Salmonella enterica]EBW2429183.1 hypothetical protein [Salmonella enterica subsp. enterica serovar Brancaster]EJN2868569.1 hypothetical protein [Salmonella enterica subsp. enterica serovar Derby]EBB4456960.1 hypothetical protein [Salmonella enterica]EKA8317845.1 hypothetical protein [Salmonella enterica]